MYTMKGFIEKKIAVRTGTGEKQKKFLEMCEKEGLMWRLGDVPTDWIPDKYGAKTCIICRLNSTDKKRYLYYGREEYYKKEGIDVVSVDEFLRKSEKRNDYEIKICVNGNMTTAEMIVDGDTVKTATAKRNPADKFNFKTGAELAFTRLFAKKVEEKDDNRPLRVGDRVVCKADGNERLETVGKHGKIIELSEGSDSPLVEFDRDINGHSGSGRGKEGHCWWCKIETLVREKGGNGKDTRAHDPEKCAYFSAGKCLGTKESDPCKREGCEKWRRAKK